MNRRTLDSCLCAITRAHTSRPIVKCIVFITIHKTRKQHKLQNPINYTSNHAENKRHTRAPAFRAILLALMSVFSTKTFLALSRSFSLRSFWYGAAALSVASTANLLTGPYNTNNCLDWRHFVKGYQSKGQLGIQGKMQ